MTEPRGSTELRLATPDDNDALLALSALCPLDADVSTRVEREPDFFALGEARGRSWTLIAESGDQVVGCVTCSRRRAWLQGLDTEIGVISDLFVHPDWRGRRVARELLEGLTEAEADLPPTPFIGLVPDDNPAAERALRYFGGERPLLPLGGFTAYQLLPMLPPLSPRVEIREATVDDTDELLALLDGYFSEHQLAPVFRNGGLADLLERSPGMELASYQLAFRDDRIIAALGSWDQRAVRRTRVLDMPTSWRMFTGAMNAANHLLPLCRLPTPDDVLEFHHLRHLCHLEGEQEALRELVRAAVIGARAREEHFALLAMQDGDPVVDILRRMPRTNQHYTLLAGASQPEAVPLVEALVGGRLFDDPALM